MTTSRLSLDDSTPGRLVVDGVIDTHTAGRLGEAIDSHGIDDDLSIDLRAVEFIDSSGLRVLIGAHQKLDGVGRRLVLAGVSDPVQKLFEITGLTGHLHTAE